MFRSFDSSADLELDIPDSNPNSSRIRCRRVCVIGNTSYVKDHLGSITKVLYRTRVQDFYLVLLGRKKHSDGLTNQLINLRIATPRLVDSPFQRCPFA